VTSLDSSSSRASRLAPNFRFPVFLDLSGKQCLVVGHAFDIAAKVAALVEAGARTIYVNPHADPQIVQLAESGQVEWRQRDFVPSDLDGCFLVIAALANNAPLFQLAEARNILCNAVDDPAHCRFSFGSVHRQGELTLAISTNGWAPALAVRLREMLERELGPEYGTLLEALKRVRPEIQEGIADFDKRRELWYQIVDSNALTLLREGHNAEAEALVRKMVRDALTGQT